MLTKAELVDAKEELINAKSTIQNCEKLAAVCTVLEHLYPEDTIPEFEDNYSGAVIPTNIIGSYGDSEFLSEINGRNLDEIIPLLDELITAIQVVNPRLYASFMRKLVDI